MDGDGDGRAPQGQGQVRSLGLFRPLGQGGGVR